MFVCLGFGHFILFVYFFPWPKLKRKMGRHFSVTYPLKGV